MKFTVSRQHLASSVDSLGLVLGHHIENATRAIVYARYKNQDLARWYAGRARADLADYLEFRRRKAKVKAA